MVKYVALAAVVLVVLSVYNGYLFISQKKKNHVEKEVRWIRYIPFVILFIALFLKPTELSLQAIENKSTDFAVSGIGEIAKNKPEAVKPEVRKTENIKEENTKEENTKAENTKAENTKEENTKVENTKPEVTREETQEKNEPKGEVKTGIELQNTQLANSDEQADTFLDTFIGLNNETELYLDQPIMIEGFVYREAYFDTDAMIVSRLLVTCCTADAAVVGVYVQSEDCRAFDEDAWVKVEGTLVMGDVYDPTSDRTINALIIKDPVITEIEPFESRYIYYQF